jgi:putative membrane protein
MWMYGTAWWMWLLMAAGTIGFWVLVAVTVKALLDDRRPETPATPDPTLVLDGRLARGEIDADEYLRLRRLIQQGH